MVTCRKQTIGSIHGTLGVLVSTDKYLDHVVKLTTAAFAKGLMVSLFFTGKGVLLTMKPQFSKLVGKCTLRVCAMSFRAFGLHGKEHLIPGATRNDFTTQAENAEMLAKSDRHLVF